MLSWLIFNLGCDFSLEKWINKDEFTEYQVFSEGSLCLFSSTPSFFFSAFTRSFSMAAFRNCWKTSLDDLTDTGTTDCLASFAQESAFFRTMS